MRALCNEAPVRSGPPQWPQSSLEAEWQRVKVDLERVESFAAPAEDASPDDAKAETDEAAPAKRTRGRNGIGSTGR